MITYRGERCAYVKRTSAAVISMVLTLLCVPAGNADPPYGSCKEAHADGAYNIKKGDPGYRPALDRDHDGIACEG
ncbi:excalibur calcium-binding domain-containing protein [Mycobacteroides abscessus subsp. abscessus]|nr:excalibur calcium-binding domain-containing protein [Mycobacteroides abscessus subsp. abscessus]